MLQSNVFECCTSKTLFHINVLLEENLSQFAFAGLTKSTETPFARPFKYFEG